MNSKAFLPHLISTKNESSSLLLNLTQAFVVVSLGVVAMAVLSQIALPLPGTPVPLTGQTFGVVLIALLMGSALGTTTLISYFGLGMLGAPIMAMGGTLTHVGPTSGYLVGMVLAAYLVGLLSDRGQGRSFWSAFTISFFAGLFIIALGTLGLRLFLPEAAVLAAGAYPFIAGDLIKSLAVAVIMSRLDPKPS